MCTEFVLSFSLAGCGGDGVFGALGDLVGEGVFGGNGEGTVGGCFEIVGG